MPETFTLWSSELPDSFLAETAARIHTHSVALIRVTKDEDGNDKGLYIGSGTLISVNNVFGILTAQHVAGEFTGPCWMGLTIGRQRQSNTFKIQSGYFHVVEIGIPQNEQYGPDLAFIQLATPDIGTIKATKSFHAILPDRKELLTNPPAIDFGVWFMAGAAGERMKAVAWEDGFRESLVFQLDCGLCEVVQEYRKQDHDYLDAAVTYSEQTDPPSTFGGMSGGGLWHVMIAQHPDGSLSAKQIYLAGVIYYQTAVEDRRRSIRCHGRLSIYERAIDEILAKCA